MYEMTYVQLDLKPKNLVLNWRCGNFSKTAGNLFIMRIRGIVMDIPLALVKHIERNMRSEVLNSRPYASHTTQIVF